MPIKNPIGLGPGLLPGAGFFGGYSSKVLSIEPANLIGYYPMDEREGSVAFDRSGKDNHGAYTGVTLGQPGIGDGSTCPFFDGVEDVLDVETAGFKADFNGLEGALLLLIKIDASGTWTDGSPRYVAIIRGDTENEMQILKNANNSIRVLYKADNTTIFKDYATSRVDWFQVGMTWSDGGNIWTPYVEGAILIDSIAPATWQTAAGTIDRALFGASDGGPSNPWKGYQSHAAIWDIPITAEQVACLGVL